MSLLPNVLVVDDDSIEDTMLQRRVINRNTVVSYRMRWGEDYLFPLPLVEIALDKCFNSLNKNEVLEFIFIFHLNRKILYFVRFRIDLLEQSYVFSPEWVGKVFMRTEPGYLGHAWELIAKSPDIRNILFEVGCECHLQPVTNDMYREYEIVVSNPGAYFLPRVEYDIPVFGHFKCCTRTIHTFINVLKK